MTFPTAKPSSPRMPLEMLTQKIAQDLMLIYAGNGYTHVAFSLIATDMAEDETVIAGNLRPEGIKQQMNVVLDRMKEQDAERFRESLGLPGEEKP